MNNVTLAPIEFMEFTMMETVSLTATVNECMHKEMAAVPIEHTLSK